MLTKPKEKACHLDIRFSRMRDPPSIEYPQISYLFEHEEQNHHKPFISEAFGWGCAAGCRENLGNEGACCLPFAVSYWLKKLLCSPDSYARASS